jgi:hypothetical protein
MYGAVDDLLASRGRMGLTGPGCGLRSSCGLSSFARAATRIGCGNAASRRPPTHAQAEHTRSRAPNPAVSPRPIPITSRSWNAWK